MHFTMALKIVLNFGNNGNGLIYVKELSNFYNNIQMKIKSAISNLSYFMYFFTYILMFPFDSFSYMKKFAILLKYLNI